MKESYESILDGRIWQDKKGHHGISVGNRIVCRLLYCSKENFQGILPACHHDRIPVPCVRYDKGADVFRDGAV